MTEMFDAAARSAVFFDETHRIIRDQLRRFVEQEIKPHAEAWEREGATPREVLRRMGELGFLGLRYPERFGGAGLGATASVVLAEELGRSGFGGVAITVLVHTDMAGVHILNAGDEAQQARWLPDIVSGRRIAAIAVTEPGAGSDVKALATRARRDGEDWVIDGEKIFITNGVRGDLVIVAARTEGAPPSSAGVSMLVVERGAPGLTVARALDKHGWRSSDTAELRLEGCRVPARNLLGQEGRGFYEIMRNFQNERLVLAAMAMGEAQAALALTLAHVRTRRAFGGALWDKQAIRQRLAMLAARVEAARHMIYALARRIEAGEETVREVSMLKALCGELVNDVMRDCVQFHGAMGFMRESAIERMARDARVQAIGGGATEVMLEEVAKRM